MMQLSGGLNTQERTYRSGTRLGPHCHELASLSLMLQGEQSESVGRRRYHCPTYFAVLKGPEIEHANTIGPPGMPTVVRVIRALSWVLSAVLYLLHLIIENRSRSRATVAAWHTSAAVAMATLLLALVATARQLGAGNRRPAVFVAIAPWPILPGLVSFVVGVVLSGVLGAASRPTNG